MSEEATEAPPEEVKPRKRGRPKGTPKTGGRQKGTRNWTNPEIRHELLDRSDAINVLADIVAGRQLYCGAQGSVGKPGWRYPSMNQRIQALQLLLAKTAPDLKGSELTAKDGEPLIPGAAETPSNRDLARVVLGILGDAKLVEANGEEAPHFDPQHARAVMGMDRLEDASPSEASCTDTGAQSSAR